jgi:hypothetical protein
MIRTLRPFLRRALRRLVLRRAARRLLFGAALLSSACGGGGGGSAADTGTFTVALTDAPSDDVSSFTVDLTAITLTRASGGVVSLLAAPVNVDLATLDDLSQVVNVLDVPRGFYNSASVTFDFSTAVCVLNGNTTPATLFDVNGSPLSGPVTLPLQMRNSAIQALGGRHRVLELDFDLDQSLTTDTLANTVTVDPTLVVRVDRSDPKELVAFATLDSVDVGKSTADVDVKTLGGVLLTKATFSFDGGTVYQVDGVPLVGNAGLTALAAEPAGTWLQAYGAIDVSAKRLDVSYVEVGHGTYNGGDDVVEGHVVGRSGGPGLDATLTVLGHSQDASHSTFQFNTLFNVDVHFATTHVVRRDSGSAFTTDELNVGQRVRFFGTLSGVTLDATSSTSVAREQRTKVKGYALAAPSSGQLAITLDRVDDRDSTLFAWNEGGPTPADPANFVVSVGSLGDNLGIGVNTPVVARGFFSDVADASADFDALSLENRDDSPSVMKIVDRLLGMTVLTSASSSQIQFTISGSKGPLEVAAIDQGFVGVSDLPTSPAPTVVPDASPVCFTWVDAVSGAVVVETQFANFSNDVAAQLAAGRRLTRFTAIGVYDASSNTIDTTIATAVIR